MPRLVDNPDLAFRLARAIVSDIALYNQDKVASGIRNDNLFDVLAEELEEGREHFHARVSPDLPQRDHLYDRAIVDVMIKQAGKIESAIW
ncbi:hypothetical protein [Geoalkalibacter sp.]|uniref:hypothetical protein n=1 Tax=Geoalkalibacter sp. TaxID=3041440 RepID=UPI00272E9D2C|nr:hypothetical protein [Geoalkalibacter sp.]